MKSKAIPAFLPLLLLLNFTFSLAAPSNGTIQIHKDDYGSFVYVDNEDGDQVPMMLSLYHSETILAGSCLNMTDTFKDDTGASSTTTTIQNPLLTADIRPLKHKLILDTRAWSLRNNGFLASSCKSNWNTPDFYGKGRAGIIGLGSNGTSLGNYMSKMKVFTLNLNPDPALSDRAVLCFYLGTKYLNTSGERQHVAKFDPTPDWRVKGTFSLATVGLSRSYSNAEFLLDLNNENIGIPSEFYLALMDKIESKGRLNCNKKDLTNKGFISCTNKGQNLTLPKIVIQIGKSKLAIPPEIYAQQQGNTVHISFRPFDVEGKTIIILGAVFMKYYVPVFFPGLANELYLYQANGKEYYGLDIPDDIPDDGDENENKKQNGNGYGPVIIGGIVALVAVIGIGLGCWLKKKSVKEDEIYASLLESQSEKKNPRESTAQML